MREPAAPRLCPLGFAFTKVDDEMVALQDQGKPGPGDCDLDVNQWLVTSEGAPTKVIGFDCWMRERAKGVVATTAPNRPDGTCGQPNPS